MHLTDQAAAHFEVPDTARVGTSELSKISASVPVGRRRPAAPRRRRADDRREHCHRRRLPRRSSGAERIQAILNNSNSAGISAADGRAHSFFAWATRLASSVEVHRVTRPPEGWHLDIVLDHIASIIVDQGSTTPP